MTRYRRRGGGRYPQGILKGPEYVDDMLVVAIDNPDVDAYAEARMADGPVPHGAVGVIHRYLERNPGATFARLHPVLHRKLREASSLGIALSAEEAALAPLASLRILRLARPEDQAVLRRQIEAHREQITYVHPPAIRYPSIVPNAVSPGNPDQWGLGQCRFEEVWPKLDPAPDPARKAIGMIDQGTAEGHHELFQRISYVPPARDEGLNSPHAARVAGVIAAIRDGSSGEMLRGCCSAAIHLYNVWRGTGRFDACAYYRALLAVAQDQLPVLNLSMTGAEDKTERRHIRTCLNRDVVVVAAMGLPHQQTAYPADYEEVIAVGGTKPGDKSSENSRAGHRMWLAAPCDSILTLEGRDEYESRTGTSFSAAFVSAAVWIARREKPCLCATEIRDLLTDSVDPKTKPGGGPSVTLGHGRLDMVRLGEALTKFRKCPDPLP